MGESNTQGAKRGGFTMMKMLILFGMIPLVVTSILLVIIAGSKIRGSVSEDTVGKLAVANKSFNAYVTDWYAEEGEEAFTGENKDYSFVDSFKENHVEFTIFIGDTRALTSLKDKSGKRIEGTQASEGVISSCLKGGQHFQNNGVEINGIPYYVDYLPLKDPDGNIVGMTFAGESDANVKKASSSAVTAMIVVCLIFVVIFATIISVVAGVVKKPLVELADALAVVAGGDLSSEITAKSIITENINMIASLKSMQDNLGVMVGDIRSEADNILGNVEYVEKMSEQSADSTNQITSAVGELSMGATSMAENVNDINEQMTEMGDKVNEIEENVEGLNSNADRMNQVSLDAANHMAEVMKSSESTVAAVDKINQQILLTNDSIGKINNAIDLIIEIASQTNLLALNATIEAARAGEAGRGFAVVADNISNLSEQSNESAAAIRDIAAEILRNSSASVELADKIKHTIEDEQNVVKETQERFDQLNEAINESVAEIGVISEKTTDLNSIKEVLISHITDLSAISEENAANNEEVNASVENIAQSMNDIVERMANMNKLSHNLEDSVSHFK
ncbi:MAG: cache domain-containing protein [Lachnospiraceae bacterium]|nr:cache domain-containing protein [Lachnospiraceae bacterium]